MRRRFVIILAALAFSTLGAAQVRAGVIFSDNFDAGASPLWGNEVGGWTATGGVYSATFPGNFPNAHSSLPFSLTDFSIDLDINAVQDGGVWLRSAAAPGTSVGRTGVLLVTGGALNSGTGLYWHIIPDGNSYGAGLNDAGGLFIPAVSDPHIRVEVSGDTYSAYVNGSLAPSTTLITSAFVSGQAALYDFSNQTFDNVVLATPDPAPTPEPSSLLLATIGLAGVVCRGRWPGRRA